MKPILQNCSHSLSETVIYRYILLFCHKKHMLIDIFNFSLAKKRDLVNIGN
ncbi:hypothetical protein LEP1GSC203_0761 [Leptospira terpstrae serovar Hualin str. LT 11-33 = ATCC 700639]|uniref:Uncharacterized protein n=1 Tax=Leptospira terpstrae serovar Hualin str. LT 11-33 = ATCC 700639 TaxID=1257025 RepID=N1VSY3_9LEPT|nr:hypothetical protein LEP1GSC203_0761 [Leptospira terpstrae serovar Hualin str. LT 11-33 = ATCC 700639]